MEYNKSDDDINKDEINQEEINQEDIKELRKMMSKRITNLRNDYFKLKKKVSIIVNLIFPGLGFWILEEGKKAGYITFFMYYGYLFIFMFNKIYKLEQPKMIIGLLPLIIINLLSTFILNESDR